MSEHVLYHSAVWLKPGGGARSLLCIAMRLLLGVLFFVTAHLRSMRRAWTEASALAASARSKSAEKLTAPAWSADAEEGLMMMGTRASAGESADETSAQKSDAPVLCTREEMEKIGVPLNLDMLEMQKMEEM